MVRKKRRRVEMDPAGRMKRREGEERKSKEKVYGCIEGSHAGEGCQRDAGDTGRCRRVMCCGNPR